MGSVLGPHEFLGLAVEVARRRFDPAERWDEFVQAVWEQVDAGFGLTADGDLPPLWFEGMDDPDVVVWDRLDGR